MFLANWLNDSGPGRVVTAFWNFPKKYKPLITIVLSITLSACVGNSRPDAQEKMNYNQPDQKRLQRLLEYREESKEGFPPPRPIFEAWGDTQISSFIKSPSSTEQKILLSTRDMVGVRPTGEIEIGGGKLFVSTVVRLGAKSLLIAFRQKTADGRVALHLAEIGPEGSHRPPVAVGAPSGGTIIHGALPLSDGGYFLVGSHFPSPGSATGGAWASRVSNTGQILTEQTHPGFSANYKFLVQCGFGYVTVFSSAIDERGASYRSMLVGLDQNGQETFSLEVAPAGKIAVVEGLYAEPDGTFSALVLHRNPRKQPYNLEWLTINERGEKVRSVSKAVPWGFEVNGTARNGNEIVVVSYSGDSPIGSDGIEKIEAYKLPSFEIAWVKTVPESSVGLPASVSYIGSGRYLVAPQMGLLFVLDVPDAWIIGEDGVEAVSGRQWER